MESKNGLSLVLAGLVSLWAPVAPAESQNQAAPTVPLPQSGVPLEALQEHQPAGQRRVQSEDMNRPPRPGPGGGATPL